MNAVDGVKSDRSRTVATPGPRESVAGVDRRAVGAIATVLIIGVLGIGTVLYDPGNVVGWLGATAFVFVVSHFVGVVPHEAAHAVASRLLGMRVRRIVVGVGTPIVRRRVGDVDVVIRIYPAGGTTWIEPLRSDLRFRRAREVVAFAAGPLANLVLGAAVFGWVLADEQAMPGRFGWELVAAVFVTSSFFEVATNLVPSLIMEQGRAAANDGLRIVRCLLPRSGAVGLAGPRGGGVPVRVLRHVRWLTTTAAVVTSTVFLLKLAVALAGAMPDPALLRWGAAALVLTAITTAILLGSGEAPALAHLDDSDGHGSVWLRIARDLDPLQCAAGEARIAPALASVDEHLRGRRLDAAERALEEATAECPASVLAALRRIHLRVLQGRERDALAVIADLEGAGLSSATLSVARGEFFTALLSTGEHARVLAAIREWVAVTGADEVCLVLDRIASDVLVRRDPSQLAVGEECAALGLAVDPDSMPLRATRGALLVELGELDRGLPVLEDVLAHADIEADVGLAALFLAIGARRRGDLRRARRLARRARRLLPEPWVEQRIRDELGSSSS